MVVKVRFTTKIGRRLIYLHLSSLTIPKREDLRKKWLNVLKHVRRKGGADSFDVKKTQIKEYLCASSISRMKI